MVYPKKFTHWPKSVILGWSSSLERLDALCSPTIAEAIHTQETWQNNRAPRIKNKARKTGTNPRKRGKKEKQQQYNNKALTSQARILIGGERWKRALLCWMAKCTCRRFSRWACPLRNSVKRSHSVLQPASPPSHPSFSSSSLHQDSCFARMS